MRQNQNLKVLLDFLEEHIDLQNAEKSEKLNLDSIMFRDISHLPLSIRLEDSGDFKPYPYVEAFDDPEKMLFNELLFSHGECL